MTRRGIIVGGALLVVIALVTLHITDVWSLFPDEGSGVDAGGAPLSGDTGAASDAAENDVDTTNLLESDERAGTAPQQGGQLSAPVAPPDDIDADPKTVDPKIAEPNVSPPPTDEPFADETQLSAEQVERAIRVGVSWLKKKQARNGSWGYVQRASGVSHHTGATSLALYTLLACRESLKDPIVKKGFAYLKAQGDPETAPEVAMSILAHCATARKVGKSRGFKLKGRERQVVSRLVELLMRDRGDNPGWRYAIGNSHGHTPDRPRADVTSTHVVALALLAAHRCRVNVSNETWRKIGSYFVALQQAEGPPAPWPENAMSRGMPYADGLGEWATVTGARTACGVASLSIVSHILGSRNPTQWAASELGIATAASERDALAWLSESWDPLHNPKGTLPYSSDAYWMWTLETAMNLTGHRVLNKRPWYRDVGIRIVGTRHAHGFWDLPGDAWTPSDVLDTCFSLLTLKQATRDWAPQ